MEILRIEKKFQQSIFTLFGYAKKD